MKKLTINQWAIEDRPREKMMLKGAEALSDAELLAILIGSGNTEESAVTLMQRTLACCNNDLNRLGKWEVHDFSRFKGLGPAKSITIMAALELGKRRKLQEHPEHTVIRSSNDIYEIFHPLLCDLTIEEFWVLLLNQATHVIDKVRISRGGIDQTSADVRSVLREALLQRATQIALVHNHPSGNPHPSDDDRRLTQLIQKGAQTMNIRMIDHVPVNVYDLGLIYKIDVSDSGEAVIDMTLTAPNCPAADFIMEDVRQKVESIDGVESATVNLVFEPEWDKDMMSEEAKLELGFL